MYANANLIVLNYTVQSLEEDLSKVFPDRPLPGDDWGTGDYSYEPQLRRNDGLAFPWLRDAGWGIPKESGSSLLVYDARQLAENLPTELKLHLTLDKAEVLIPLKAGGGSMHRIKGPFTFDFSMPVDTVCRIGEVNQTATGHEGDRITIEKVIATRHNALVTWRLEKSTASGASATPTRSASDFYTCCRVRLGSGPQSPTFEVALPSLSGEPEVGDSIIFGNFTDKQDEWIISMWYVSTWIGDMFYPDQPGPVFRFTVPPATNSLQAQNH
jgi:hypothetical protein